MSDEVQVITGGRVKRIGRQITGEQGDVMLARPGFKSRRKLLCKAGGSAILIVATMLAIGVGSRMTNVETSAVHRPVEPSQHCAKKYAELFDLAQLAKRDGKSSGIMVRELTVMAGQMNECLVTAPDHVQVSR